MRFKDSGRYEVCGPVRQNRRPIENIVKFRKALQDFSGHQPGSLHLSQATDYNLAGFNEVKDKFDSFLNMFENQFGSRRDGINLSDLPQLILENFDNNCHQEPSLIFGIRMTLFDYFNRLHLSQKGYPDLVSQNSELLSRSNLGAMFYLAEDLKTSSIQSSQASIRLEVLDLINLLEDNWLLSEMLKWPYLAKLKLIMASISGVKDSKPIVHQLLMQTTGGRNLMEVTLPCFIAEQKVIHKANFFKSNSEYTTLVSQILKVCEMAIRTLPKIAPNENFLPIEIILVVRDWLQGRADVPDYSYAVSYGLEVEKSIRILLNSFHKPVKSDSQIQPESITELNQQLLSYQLHLLTCLRDLHRTMAKLEQEYSLISQNKIFSDIVAKFLNKDEVGD